MHSADIPPGQDLLLTFIVIAAMTLCGIAGGASLNAFACVSELVSRKQRGVYFALVNAACLAFTVAGSLIGENPCAPQVHILT